MDKLNKYIYNLGLILAITLVALTPFYLSKGYITDNEKSYWLSLISIPVLVLGVITFVSTSRIVSKYSITRSRLYKERIFHCLMALMYDILAHTVLAIIFVRTNEADGGMAGLGVTISVLLCSLLALPGWMYIFSNYLLERVLYKESKNIDSKLK